jgi:tyrosyl-tRNA synthetase
MNFVEELQWRGLLHQKTEGLEAAMEKAMIIGYIGYDPTAPSLTIGNLVTIMLLKHLQLKGHKPMVLLGGATGRIGDPSFKDKERVLKTAEELETNLQFQKTQFAKFLDFSDAPNGAVIVNNYDFYKNMNVLDFLRDVGKTLTVNYMMSKESVKRRIETGISFTEFSYQLLQGYDFQLLYQTQGVCLQMGGSDQWGNIVSGTEMIRKNIGSEAEVFALTCPLLTKADGQKFGKSEEGNIWLSADLTSPYKFYQYWLNIGDADALKANRTFSLKSTAEIEALEQQHAEAPHLRLLQKALAEELTIWVHSSEDYEAVKVVSELLFNKNVNREYLLNLSETDLKTVAAELPSFEVEKAAIAQGIDVTKLLAEKVFSSNSEVRRAIKGNALAINKQKITAHDQIISAESWLHGRYLMVENGKKDKFIFVCSDC